MELVEQYLQSVRGLLPKAERDDIVAELSANITDQMEETREALGRPLTEAEQRAILEQLGSPLAVAGRYTDERRSLAFGRELIGPVLFPLYSRVLALNLAITTGVCLIVALAVHGSRGVFPSVAAILAQLLIQFGILTWIFALAQRHLARVPGSEATAPAARTTTAEPEAVSRLESVAQLVALAGLFIAAYAARGYDATLFSPGGAGLYLAPACRLAVLAILALAVVWSIQAAINLLRPGWKGFRQAVQVSTGVAWLGMLLWLLSRGPWVLLSPADVSPRARHAVDAANASTLYTLLVVAVVSALVLAWHAISAVRQARRA